MNILKFLTLIIFCVVVTAPQDSLAQKKTRARPPVPVELKPVIEKEISASINLIGTVRALKESVISTEVDGRVIAINKKEGDVATEGEVIVALDEAPYRIRVRAAEGNELKAIAALEKAKLAARRARKLFTKEITSEELKQNAEWDVKAAEGELVIRKAELEQARLNLARCRIKAPYDGFFAKKLTDIGYWVKNGDGLFEMVDIHMVEVQVEAPERHIKAFTIGSHVQVTLDAYPEKVFKGAIDAISPKGNIKTRAFTVKISIDNEKSEIKAGMLARAQFSTELKTKVILIPRDAVVWKSRKALVFTVDGEGKAKSRQVILGRQHGDLVEAKGGLVPGLKVIVTGNEILRDGQNVAVSVGK